MERSPRAELNKNVLHKAAALLLKTTTTVTYNEFEIASKDHSGDQLISTAAIKKFTTGVRRTDPRFQVKIIIGHAGMIALR